MLEVKICLLYMPWASAYITACTIMQAMMNDCIYLYDLIKYIQYTQTTQPAASSSVCLLIIKTYIFF